MRWKTCVNFVELIFWKAFEKLGLCHKSLEAFYFQEFFSVSKSIVSLVLFVRLIYQTSSILLNYVTR
jgi:hypothetical protein